MHLSAFYQSLIQKGKMYTNSLKFMSDLFCAIKQGKQSDLREYPYWIGDSLSGSD